MTIIERKSMSVLGEVYRVVFHACAYIHIYECTGFALYFLYARTFDATLLHCVVGQGKNSPSL